MTYPNHDNKSDGAFKATHLHQNLAGTQWVTAQEWAEEIWVKQGLTPEEAKRYVYVTDVGGAAMTREGWEVYYAHLRSRDRASSGAGCRGVAVILGVAFIVFATLLTVIKAAQ